MKVISYLGMLDRVFGVPVTTRNWNALSQIAKVLDNGENLPRRSHRQDGSRHRRECLKPNEPLQLRGRLRRHAERAMLRSCPESGMAMHDGSKEGPKLRSPARIRSALH